jgi:hypothetical protein
MNDPVGELSVLASFFKLNAGLSCGTELLFTGVGAAFRRF